MAALTYRGIAEHNSGPGVRRDPRCKLGHSVSVRAGMRALRGDDAFFKVGKIHALTIVEECRRCGKRRARGLEVG